MPPDGDSSLASVCDSFFPEFQQFAKGDAVSMVECDGGIYTRMIECFFGTLTKFSAFALIYSDPVIEKVLFPENSKQA